MNDPLVVRLSECGLYWAVLAPVYGPAFDVLEVDGECVWLWPRYQPTRQDTDPRSVYPEVGRLVVSWSNHSYPDPRAPRRRVRRRFELGFCDCDITRVVLPGQGNTILPGQNFSAFFERPFRTTKGLRAELRRRILEYQSEAEHARELFLETLACPVA